MNREFARERFVFADDRHRPEGQHRLRIELSRQFAQQIGFFDGQIRRNNRRQPTTAAVVSSVAFDAAQVAYQLASAVATIRCSRSCAAAIVAVEAR